MTVYSDNGYLSRTHYLQCLAEDYGCSFDRVRYLADLLGEEEDFDALVIALEDGEMPND